MNKKQYISFVLSCAAAAVWADEPVDAAVAGQAPAPAEMQNSADSPWRFSVGTRFAPGVKTRAGTSRSAFSTLSGRMSFSGLESTSVRSRNSVKDSSSSTKETGSLAPVDGRYEFDAGFIDMNDSAGIEGETWYWHLDDTVSFDEATGTFRIPLGTSSDSDSTSLKGAGTRASESFDPTGTSDVREEDLWGFDAAIGYDFVRSARWTLGLGLGFSVYEDADAFRVANRFRKTKRSETVVSQTKDSSLSISETAFVTDSSHIGAKADLLNDDGSYGAGTYDGYDNPYGGYNPVLSVSGVTTEKTIDAQTRTTTRSIVTESTLAVDLDSKGTVSTWEARLAVQPAYRVSDNLELRGTFGAVMTHVDVDVDSAVFVNGTGRGGLSTGDDGYVFAGLLGLDVVWTPKDWFDLFLGADLRLGPNDWDFDTGLVQGSVELSRATYRAGASIRF